MKLFKGEIRAPKVAKVLIPKVHYELMHLKLQNIKTLSEYNSILHAPEVAKFLKCKWIQFFIYLFIYFLKYVHNYNYVRKSWTEEDMLEKKNYISCLEYAP